MRRLHVHSLSALPAADGTPSLGGRWRPAGKDAEVSLPYGEAHHARTVLRLSAGDAVEVFDDAGRVAVGEVTACGPAGVSVRVGQVRDAGPAGGRDVEVACAVPKGERADLIAEKLGELGVRAWWPLVTARSVVTPGANKVERWNRIAVEAAKQSRRAGVLSVSGACEFAGVLDRAATRGMPKPERGGRVRRRRLVWLSTDPTAAPLLDVLARLDAEERADGGEGPAAVMLFVGPEGGWTAEEEVAFAEAGASPARLTRTVLRVETAAVVAAAVALLE